MNEHKNAPDLEQRMLDDIKAGKQIGVDIPLERALLIASGVRTERRMEGYLEKLDEMHRLFQSRYKPRPGKQRALSVAVQLYHFLMKGRKDNDYRFQLNRVIDAFFEGKDAVLGNCLGLTQLYTLIGQREGLDLKVLSFDGHMCNVIDKGNKKIKIDLKAYPYFGKVKGDQTNEGEEEPIQELAKHVYYFRAYENQRRGRYEKALHYYRCVLYIDPFCYEAQTGIGTVKIDSVNRERDRNRVRKFYEESRDDYRRAISLKLTGALAYINLSIAEEALGNVEDAQKYCLLAHRYNPNHPSVKRQMRNLSLA